MKDDRYAVLGCEFVEWLVHGVRGVAMHVAEVNLQASVTALLQARFDRGDVNRFIQRGAEYYAIEGSLRWRCLGPG